MNPRQRLALLASAVAGLLLTGCGAPPWQTDDPEPSPTATVSAIPTPTPTPTPSASPKIKNDLAKGSAKSELTAGGVQLKINYWSTLNIGEWTPAATKPLSLSMNGRFADGATQDIFLNNVTVTIDVHGPEGQLPAPADLTDNASVSPGYLITAPNAYVKVFNLPGWIPKPSTSP